MLSIEELLDIIKHLNLLDRTSFSMTSHRHKRLVNSTILPSVIQLLSQFTSEPMAFLQLLWSNNAIIGGPIALAALFPNEEPRPDQKLHIYVPAFDNQNFLEALRDQHNYQMTGAFRLKAKHFIQNSVEKVIRLRNANNATISVLFSRDHTALTPIFHLSATHNMNFISAHGIYCAYPHFTFAKNTILHPKSIYNIKMNQEVGKVIERYTSYGLKVYQSFKSLSVDHPHSRCRIDIQCPHLLRTLYDKHGFFAPMDFPMTSSLRPNQLSYNEDNGVVWNLGGEGCEAHMTTNDSFVVSTWLSGGKYIYSPLQLETTTKLKYIIYIAVPTRFGILEDEIDE